MPQQKAGEFSGLESTTDRVIVEAFGELQFTDFGIEPYSAMLGAVKTRTASTSTCT